MHNVWHEFKAGWKEVKWVDYFLIFLFPSLLIAALLAYFVEGHLSNPPSILQLVFAIVGGLASLYLSTSQSKFKKYLQENLPFQKLIQMSFAQWAFRCDPLIVVTVCSSVFMTAASSIYKGIIKFNDVAGMQYLLLLTYGVQSGVIFLWILLSPKLTHLIEVKSPAQEFTISNSVSEHEVNIMKALGYNKVSDWGRAKSLSVALLNQFRHTWFGAWICWLGLYLALTISYLPNNDNNDFVNALNIVARLFNNSATLMLSLCYTILSQSIAVKAQTANYNNRYNWVAALIIFSLIDAISVAMSVNVLPNVFGFNPHYVTDIFNWISGIASAIVLALFVGRLDSKFFATPPWILVMLYMYVAIQPMFALLGEEQKWLTIILINLALILKCLLYFYIIWLLQTGRLLFYIIQVRSLYQEVDFRNFSAILHKAS